MQITQEITPDSTTSPVLCGPLQRVDSTLCGSINFFASEPRTSPSLLEGIDGWNKQITLCSLLQFQSKTLLKQLHLLRRSTHEIRIQADTTLNFKTRVGRSNDMRMLWLQKACLTSPAHIPRVSATNLIVSEVVRELAPTDGRRDHATWGSRSCPTLHCPDRRRPTGTTCLHII